MPDSIVTCQCGAKVRAPDDPAVSFRCPRCKAELSSPAAAAVQAAAAPVISAEISSATGTMCPICQTAIAASEPVTVCPGCDQIHHRECWTEIGGCGTFGCREAPAVDKGDHTAQAPLSAWGDSKKCPACGEEIKAIAVRCRYCGTDFDSVDPMSAADLRRQAIAGQELKSFKAAVVVIFVLSLVGCLAPLMALVSALYLLPKRAKLAKCGPLFTILGWTSLLLSCLYSVMLALFFLAENT